jgi:hypothetical protein
LLDLKVCNDAPSDSGNYGWQNTVSISSGATGISSVPSR